MLEQETKFINTFTAILIRKETVDLNTCLEMAFQLSKDFYCLFKETQKVYKPLFDIVVAKIWELARRDY